MFLEQSSLKFLEKRKSSKGIRHGLNVLSLFFRALVHMRNLAYDKNWLKSTQADLPVFSIGNIAVGGTGKTPLTLLLAESLEVIGPIAILSRGFKSQIEKRGDCVQISSGQGPLVPVAECGDEPFFLAQESRASIWVSPNRIRSAKEATKAQMRCLILDDGMQHRKLKRDIEIIVVDGLDPVAQGQFLPAGLLRDSPKRLQNADLIVANHVRDEIHYAQIQEILSKYTKAPLVGMNQVPVDPALFAYKKLSAFCGIGKPKYFYETLKGLGSDVVETLNLLDHQPIQEEQLISFAKSSYLKGAELVVCTEKDWVKLPFYKMLPLPIVPVKVRLKIIAGQEHWDRAVEKMKHMVLK